MLRSLGLVLFASTLAAQAPIFPDLVGDYVKSAPKTLVAPDQLLYGEFGLDATEQADYKAPGKQFSASGWRFKDATGALAMFESRRPPGATPSKVTQLSSRTSDGLILVYGNYVFQFTGAVPEKPELDRIYASLPRWNSSPLPALMGFLPAEGLVPNSERYVLGPVSLERFEPRIPPSTAGFHLGAEAQLGKYKTPKGDVGLALFSYPTPTMARAQFEEFQKLPGAMAKRSQSLVAVILQPPDANAAEQLLAKVRYEANLTEHQVMPQNFNKGLSNMIMSIMALAGIVIVLCVVVGIGFGGFRYLAVRVGLVRADAGAMTVLSIGDKPTSNGP